MTNYKSFFSNKLYQRVGEKGKYETPTNWNKNFRFNLVLLNVFYTIHFILESISKITRLNSSFVVPFLRLWPGQLMQFSYTKHYHLLHDCVTYIFDLTHATLTYEWLHRSLSSINHDLTSYITVPKITA